MIFNGHDGWVTMGAQIRSYIVAIARVGENGLSVDPV